MSPSSPRTQAQIFYSSKWTQEMDNDFIEVLSDFATSRDRPILKQARDVLNFAMSRVNARHGTSFTVDHAVVRYKKLRVRHEAYAGILANPYVRYDSESNMPRTNEMIWDYLMMKHPGAEAYISSGEPNGTQLCNIFGPPPPHQEINSRRIICILDDTRNTSTTGPNPNTTALSRSPGTLPISQPSIGSSFWNSLEDLVPEGAANSQDSVKNKPLRGPGPSSPSYGRYGDTRNNVPTSSCDRRFHFGPFQPTSGGGPSTSHVGSSGTPKKSFTR